MWVVIWILNELQIPFQDVVETNLEMKNHMIPAGLCLPNHLDSERSIQMPNQASNLPSSSMASSLDTMFKRNEQTFERHLSSHQKILLRRTEPIMFQSILPLIRKHIRLGHTQLQIYIIPNEIKPHTIANEKITQEYTFPKEFLVLYPEMNGPDLLFLLQPDVMLLMNRLIENYQPTGDCQTSVQNLTTRIETPVGLFESRSFDLLVLTIRFYVQ
ncbi:hypothetical protein HDV02_005305 [Globomyces sp. JEL0801]|nr:hypothetical protein HDV02_005305 [Globomyces sp. JEL0801]